MKRIRFVVLMLLMKLVVKIDVDLDPLGELHRILFALVDPMFDDDEATKGTEWLNNVLELR